MRELHSKRSKAYKGKSIVIGKSIGENKTVLLIGACEVLAVDAETERALDRVVENGMSVDATEFLFRLAEVVIDNRRGGLR